MRLTLLFLKKVTLEPDAVSANDVRPLLAAGISVEAIRDAIYVCYLFNTYDRLADTFGWHIPPQGSFDAGAKRLLKVGYR